jgi:hypothetical protein
MRHEFNLCVYLNLSKLASSGDLSLFTAIVDGFRAPPGQCASKYIALGAVKLDPLCSRGDNNAHIHQIIYPEVKSVEYYKSDIPADNMWPLDLVYHGSPQHERCKA